MPALIATAENGPCRLRGTIDGVQGTILAIKSTTGDSGGMVAGAHIFVGKDGAAPAL